MNKQEILKNINSLLNEVTDSKHEKFGQLKANCFQLGLSVNYCMNEFKKNGEVK